MQIWLSTGYLVSWLSHWLVCPDPHGNSWVQYLAPVSDSSILCIQALGSNGDGLGSCIPAADEGALGWIVAFFGLAESWLLAVKQQISTWSTCLSISLLLRKKMPKRKKKSDLISVGRVHCQASFKEQSLYFHKVTEPLSMRNNICEVSPMVSHYWLVDCIDSFNNLTK